MKKRLISCRIIAFLAVVSVLFLCGCASSGNQEIKALYLGVKDYKDAAREDVLTDFNPVYGFEINREARYLCVACDEDYTLQNRLMDGCEYYIRLDGDTVTAVRNANDADIKGTVKGYTPGERTVKNFLSTAVAPIGSTLYVYGGGWNFQDDGASLETMRIGLSPSWEKYYLAEDEDYSYMETYPDNGWNTFYYKGLDCTGYLGWVIYNTLYDESETGEGFVGGVFNKLSEKHGLGSVVHPTDWTYRDIFDALKPGDVIGTPGHIYIVAGKCSDGSFVILHSTVTLSSSGADGGGVQLSAVSINGDGDTDCEAYALAKRVMETQYPAWTERYPVVLKPVSIYFDISEPEDRVGIFSWSIGEAGLTDPDGIRDMSADEVLDILFR